MTEIATGRGGRRWAAGRLLRGEPTLGLVVAGFSLLLGGAAGVVWAAITPRPDIRSAYFVRPAAAHRLVGIDVWFGAVALVAGLLCAVLALVLLRRRAIAVGPLLGLVAGGGLGALVADRVGYLADGSHAVEALGRLRSLRHFSSHQLGEVASLLDFRVHIPGLLLIWPVVAAIVVGAAALLVRDLEPATGD